MSMGKFVLYGAIVVAMLAVAVGQQKIPGAEASSDITMMLVVGGLVVGAIGGGIVGFVVKKQEGETPKDSEQAN